MTGKNEVLLNTEEKNCDPKRTTHTTIFFVKGVCLSRYCSSPEGALPQIGQKLKKYPFNLFMNFT